VCGSFLGWFSLADFSSGGIQPWGSIVRQLVTVVTWVLAKYVLRMGDG
jgi:hypothetical protein